MTTRPSPSPKLVGPGEGKTVELFACGLTTRLKAPIPGSPAVLEIEIPARTLCHTTIPGRTSSRRDGTVGFRIGDHVQLARAGAALVKPRGTPHAMWNAFNTRREVLRILSPGGLKATSRSCRPS